MGMGRKSDDVANLSLVGLIIQRTDPGLRRPAKRSRPVRIHRWVLVLSAFGIGSGILLGVLRMFRVV